MFYGFVLRENQHNDLAIRVPYNKEDPLYKEKLRLAEVKRESDVEFKEFTLHAQLEGSKQMQDFINFCRFVVYDGDADRLEMAKIQAVEAVLKEKEKEEEEKRLAEARRKKQAGKKEGFDEGNAANRFDDFEPSDVYKGRAPPTTIEIETKLWTLASKLADEALSKYPDTYEDDLALLEKDDKEEFLDGNKRTCVIYRLGEKKILRYVQTTAA